MCLALLGFSCVLLLVVYMLGALVGKAVWTVSGNDTAFYIVRTQSLPHMGERVLVRTDESTAVEATVQGAVRQDGGLFYRVRTSYDLLVPARDIHGVLAFHVPFLGLWLRTLTTPVGGMALLGTPLTMLLVDMLLHIPSVDALLSSFTKRRREEEGIPVPRKGLFLTEEV